jgi:hypothetical protein
MTTPETTDDWENVTDEREVFNIVLILDESGSMSSLGNEPESCVNGFIEQMKTAGLDKEKKVIFSLYRFGTPTNITVSYKQIELKDVPDKHGFKPHGCTPLYDAIGMALTDNTGIHNGVCHIITDGQENASQRFKHSEVFDLIKKMEQEYNWTFQYTGAGKDTYTVANGLGISKGNTVQYDAGRRGNEAIALGFQAGWTGQGANAIALGFQAGWTGQVANSVAVGTYAGQTSQYPKGVAVGTYAGQTSQYPKGVAIDLQPGFTSQVGWQGTNNDYQFGWHSGLLGKRESTSVVLGATAGQNNQTTGVIALGTSAEQQSQYCYCDSSVAIGSCSN